ncbi:hypothetical protein HN51_070275 [Arachis hypogaea]
MYYCIRNVIKGALEEGFVGYITAQGRTNTTYLNRFVSKNCNVFKDGTVFLERPWRPFARVLFFNTSMSNIE